MDKLREESVQEQDKLKLLVKKANEARQAEQQKAELIQKNSLMKMSHAPPDSNHTSANFDRDHEETKEVVKQEKAKSDQKTTSLKKNDDEDSDDFERADDSEEVIEQKMGETDKQKIQNLINQMKQQEVEQAEHKPVGKINKK